jgi:3-dehydrosphinganine reductase
MARQKRKGKIVFVSSTLGYMSFVGYASYSPAKHALRGTRSHSSYSKAHALGSALADTLHSELLLYGIDVHIFFPPTMETLGYETENLTKPKITKRIEEADDGLTVEQAALGMFRGAHLYDIRGNYYYGLAYRCGKRGNAYYGRLDHKSFSSVDSRICSQKQLDTRWDI